MRIILHVDMDSFFTSVETVKDPSLKGKPVAVGADPRGGKGRGVLSTANYSAREFGLHSAMPVSIAYRKCPECIFLPVNFPLYEETSVRIMRILLKHADVLQISSIDEAYLDVSSLGSFSKASELAKKIKAEIKSKEGITASIGIGPNKLVAKIASDFQKPDGLTVITPARVTDFMWSKKIRKIPGIGPKTEAILQEVGVDTVQELAALTREQLNHLFGRTGEVLYEFSRGIDKSPVTDVYEVKSLGHEYTFQSDTDEIARLEKIIDKMCTTTLDQLVEEGFRFRTVTLKIRFTGFETHTRSKTLKEPTDSKDKLKETALFLFKKFVPLKKKVRLIGVRVTKLESKENKKEN